MVYYDFYGLCNDFVHKKYEVWLGFVNLGGSNNNNGYTYNWTYNPNIEINNMLLNGYLHFATHKLIHKHMKKSFKFS